MLNGCGFTRGGWQPPPAALGGGLRAEADARSVGVAGGTPTLGAQGCCLCDSRRLDGCPFDPTTGADLIWSLRKNIHLKTLMLRRGCLERGEPCAPVLVPQLERLS